MQNKPRANVSTEPFVRRHRSFFVTLFVLIPTLTLPVLLIFTMLKSDNLQSWCTLHVFYENSMGLKKGNQVSMSGIAIGHVKRVELIKEREIHVSFNVNSRYKHLVRKDTKARLQQRGFVGDWEIELTGGTPAFAEVDENDTLKSEKVVLVDEVIEMAFGIVDTIVVPLLKDIAAIIKGIEAGDGTIGQIFKNDTLFRYINRISANTVGITSNTIGITSDVKKLTAGAGSTIRGVDSLLSTFNILGKDATSLLDSLTPLIGTVNRTIDDVGIILKDVKTLSGEAPELFDRLQHDLGEVETMLRTLQDSWLFKSIGGSAPKNPHLADTP